MSRFFNGFDSNVFLAPMAGITDKPMRRLVSSMGPGTMVSEMVAINAISRKNPKSYRLLQSVRFHNKFCACFTRRRCL